MAQTDRRYGERTADERRAERRVQIMQAALSVYGATGFRTASVKAVCSKAGLTERYFYESFANGEDLLKQCFLQVNRTLVARMREAAVEDGRAPLERLRAALLVYFQQIKDNPEGARVFLIEMASVSAATEALVSQSLDEFGVLLLQVLGVDGPASPLLLRGVIGGGLHIARAWIGTGYAESVQGVADAALQLYALMAPQTDRNLASLRAATPEERTDA